MTLKPPMIPRPEPAEPRSPVMVALDAEIERKIQHHKDYIAPQFEFWAKYDKRNAA